MITARFPTKAIVLALGAAALLPAAALAMTVRLDKTVVQAAAPGPASCAATPGADNAAAAKVSSDRRKTHGLAPLRPNERLAKVAALHACDMAQRGLMAHHGSTTKGPAQRVKAQGYRPVVTAENIAAGPFGLGDVLGIWNNSPGHLGNILQPQVSEMGIGRAVAADGKTVFWAAVYAAPR